MPNFTETVLNWQYSHVLFQNVTHLHSCLLNNIYIFKCIVPNSHKVRLTASENKQCEN